MTFSRFLQENIVYLDGGLGTLLQARGLSLGELPERWNLTHADVVKELQTAYFNAGSNVVCTNTFGANALKFGEGELREVIRSAIQIAKDARKESVGTQEKFVALDIGPLGKLLKPLGTLDFEDAVSIFKKTVEIGVEYGVDLIVIETMNDSYETKSALLAVKETCDLPVIVTNAYGEDGKLMTGATPSAMVALLEGMGADALGVNCSLGPKQLSPIVDELLAVSSVPVVVKPNAGLPALVGGQTVFDVGAEEFAFEVAKFVEKGARAVGGCCGTTPDYIKALVKKTKGLLPVPVTDKGRTVVSSYTRSVAFENEPILIGERINPTGKKRFKQALKDGDVNYVLSEGISQAEKGVHILDVNVGLPEIDEKEMLERVVCDLQTVTDLPLQIDTSDAVAMERALRRYNGKAMLNSVNGKKECMDAVFPLVKKYGAVVVALTLDEDGIPENEGGRYEIAKKILAEAKRYGIDKKDVVFDTLAMTVSADNRAGLSTLKAMKKIKTELGCHTSLGVSNVSFGLPNRDVINATFFALALENGLSSAIMNPYSAEMMRTYYAYKALKGMDENCINYVENVPSLVSQPTASIAVDKAQDEYRSELARAIAKGLKDVAGELTDKLLTTVSPMDIVNEEIIPALNFVGEGFENKKIYLPQLLMSAESAQRAFERIKCFVAKAETARETKGKIVLATVKGDIHDIGKNIVKLLLENYGFDVVDLGKDVAPERVLKAVLEAKIGLVGLSALMTTTVPSMEETIRLLKEQAPWCKIMVGGAVLTEDYAMQIGADHYAKDAMGAVRYAEQILA